MSDRLFVRDDGPAGATTVLFLHSLFFDGSMFDDVIARLPRGWRFLRPDHLGQGRSDGHGNDDLGMDLLAQRVIELVESRNAAPVHLVGSSMGGYVALRIALRRPELLASCTLLGASATAEPDPDRFAALAEAIETRGTPALVDTLAWTMFGDDLIQDDVSPSLRRWRQRFAELPRDVAVAVRGVASRGSVLEELPGLAMPLLLLCGDQDHAKPVEHMRAIEVAVPASRLRVLTGVGHTPAVESPDIVAEELLRWIDTTGASETIASQNLLKERT